MPVMSCDCGKQLRVADEHVGKKIRCPGCGETLLVEDPNAKAPSKKPAAKTPAAAGMISFTCDCGKKMQAKAEYAGKTVKCPDCAEGVKVPGKPTAAARDDEGDEEDAPRRKSATTTASRATASRAIPTRDDPDDEDRPARKSRGDADEEDDDRPARKSKKGKKSKSGGGGMMWLLIAGGGVLLLLLVGLGLWWMFAGGVSGDMALVPGDAAGFLALRVGDLLGSDLGKDLLAMVPDAEKGMLKIQEEKMGLALTDIERATLVARNAAEFGNMRGDGAPSDIYMIVLLSKAADEKKVLSVLGDPPPSDHAGKKYYAAGNGAIYFHNDKTLLIAPSADSLKKGIDQAVKPQLSGNLAAATAAVRKQHLVLGFAAPKELLDAAKQPGAPKQAASAADLKYALVTASVKGRSVEFDATPTFGTSASATDAKKELDTSLGSVKGGAAKLLAGTWARVEDQNLLNMIGQLADNLKISQSGNSVTVGSKVDIDISQLKNLNLPGMVGGGAPGPGVGLTANDIANQNNLKKIALAFHNYHDKNGKLPGWALFVGVGPQKKAMHSWRVLLLPHLGQDALYNEIKLDEPWDSPHNVKFQQRMPDVYKMPGKSNIGGATYYQCFAGTGTLFDKQGTARRITDITDGSSNTILITEASRTVPWMKPEDIDFAQVPAGLPPAGRVNMTNPAGFFVAMADGSVRRIKPSITPMDFQNAILIADGMPVNIP